MDLIVKIGLDPDKPLKQFEDLKVLKQKCFVRSCKNEAELDHKTRGDLEPI